jgi:two-component system sensor histidine kinase KdpD
MRGVLGGGSLVARLAPFGAGVVGVAAVTAAIGVIRPWFDIPALTAAYLLLVLWLGARYGWPPAVWTAVLAFGVYEWFFVPPYGTIYIGALHDAINLVLLLGFALAGGRITASIAARMARERARARESGTLYDLAVAALREPDGTAALTDLCRRARQAGRLTTMALVDMGAGDAGVVAGDALTEEQLTRARWAYEKRTDLGARLHDGELTRIRTHPAELSPACVVLPGGVAVVGIPAHDSDQADRRLLAALLGLASLLLDRRHAAVATRRARELEASDRLKAAVLSSISHELKSPIASLRAGLTTLLIPGAGLDGDLREMVVGLDGQADRLDRLVGDLLAMSRLEAGLSLERQPHDLHELAGAVLHALHDRLVGFDVRLEFPEDLPLVSGDELFLERVLTNLLENAAAWTPAGRRITLGGRPVGADVEVWVENQGPRIPDDELELVFDKFWTSREGGSGLGLAISRRVVEAHGGTIRAENTNAGPRFRFTLPLAAPAVASAPA